MRGSEKNRKSLSVSPACQLMTELCLSLLLEDYEMKISDYSNEFTSQLTLQGHNALPKLFSSGFAASERIDYTNFSPWGLIICFRLIEIIHFISVIRMNTWRSPLNAFFQEVVKPKVKLMLSNWFPCNYNLLCLCRSYLLIVSAMLWCFILMEISVDSHLQDIFTVVLIFLPCIPQFFSWEIVLFFSLG